MAPKRRDLSESAAQRVCQPGRGQIPYPIKSRWIAPGARVGEGKVPGVVGGYTPDSGPGKEILGGLHFVIMAGSSIAGDQWQILLQVTKLEVVCIA